MKRNLRVSDRVKEHTMIRILSGFLAGRIAHRMGILLCRFMIIVIMLVVVVAVILAIDIIARTTTKTKTTSKDTTTSTNNTTTATTNKTRMISMIGMMG